MHHRKLRSHHVYPAYATFDSYLGHGALYNSHLQQIARCYKRMCELSLVSAQGRVHVFTLESTPGECMYPVQPCTLFRFLPILPHFKICTPLYSMKHNHDQLQRFISKRWRTLRTLQMCCKLASAIGRRTHLGTRAAGTLHKGTHSPASQ